jgi:hypothetical protein
MPSQTVLTNLRTPTTNQHCIEQELRDFVKQLLVRKPAYRLGQGASGAGALKKHAWFGGFDWEAFVSKRMKPPYMPVVSLRLCVGAPA